MLEGLVKKIALDFDVGNIAKVAKGSKEAKVAEVGADIELLAKESWMAGEWFFLIQIMKCISNEW